MIGTISPSIMDEKPKFMYVQGFAQSYPDSQRQALNDNAGVALE